MQVFEFSKDTNFKIRSKQEYKPLTASEVQEMLNFEQMAIDHYLDKTDDAEDTKRYKELKNRDCGDEIYFLD